MNTAAKKSLLRDNDTPRPMPDAIEIARDCGFETVGSAQPASFAVKSEVRDMCAADRCHAYGRNWACPPACGSLDEFATIIASKKTAVVVQTVAQLEDEFDFEGMQAAERLHKKRFERFADALGSAFDTASSQYRDAEGTTESRNASESELTHRSESTQSAPLFLAAGSCTVCPSCTYPDAPCRFPDKAFVSLEAAGLVVSEVCESAGIPYYHGKGTLAYTSCALY